MLFLSAAPRVLLSLTSPDNPLLKVLLPLAGIAVVLVVSTRRWHLSPRADLRLVPPAPVPLLGWLAVALAYLLGSDYLMHWRGAWDFGPWQAQPLWVSACRVLGVGILGPIAEELLFRGLLFRLLLRWGLAPVLTVGLTAAGWAALHIDYSVAVIVLIFGEGLLLGAALLHTRSLLVPIAMHIAWNLYAVS